MSADPLSLPRDLGSRLILFVGSIGSGAFLGYNLDFCWSLDCPIFHPLFYTLIYITEELLIVGILVSALVLIWAIATPQWVERLLGAALKKLYLVIGVAVFAVAVLVGLIFVFDYKP